MAAKTSGNTSAEQSEPRTTTLGKVYVKGGGHAVDHDGRGGVTVGKDADGKVVFVDFCGQDVEVE